MTHLRGPVTMMGMAGTMSAHLAEIEKVSNGFIVRFSKAQKVPIKRKGLDAFGFDDETKDLIKVGLDRLKQGDEWKNLPSEVREAADAGGGATPGEKWITTSMAVCCKNETELLAAIRDAVTFHGEIEKLMLAGEFS